MATEPREEPTDGGPPTALVNALREVLRPLIRLLLHYQMTLPFLTNLLKSVYVEVATRDLALAKRRRQTDSRISLLTGVHRKDVKRLRLEEHSSSAPAAVSLGARISSAWMTSSRMQDADGHPLPLPRGGAGVKGPSFDELVESVTKDVPARSVLDEWLRIGVAEIDEQGRVRLRVEGFVPQKGFEEKAFYLGRNVRDHIAAVANNLEAENPPLLERSVYYEGLSEAGAHELEEFAEKVSMEALLAFNRKAQAIKKRDSRRRKRTARVTLGAFFFRGNDSPEDPE